MKDEIKVKQGKVSRAQGKAFEVRTRADLESKGWIVDRWNNQVEFEEATKNIVDMGKKDFPMMAKGIKYGKLTPAKAKWNNFTKSMMMGNGGFPDFIAFRKHPGFNVKFNQYEVIGIEAKMNGELDREEKEKCKWLLDNGVFSQIFIAEKTKVKNKVVIVYHDFKMKYYRFYGSKD